MTDSLDEILSANQKLYVLNQKLTEEVKRLRECLQIISNSGELRVAVNHNQDFTDGSKQAFKMCAGVAKQALERK